MTTSAVYDLIPNEDAGQNTRYPQGDKPAPDLAPPVPTYLNTSGETLTSVDLDWGQLGDGHTKFILQRWRFNTDTVWATLTEPGKDDRSYTDSADLLEGQHVGYRIASSDGTNQSAWAPEAWTYVLVEPGSVMFQDNFNSYPIGQKMDGITPPTATLGGRWEGNSGDPVTVGPGGRSGNCLHFNYRAAGAIDATSSWCEQQLKICGSKEQALSEVWLELWLMTTDVDRVTASNDKFVAMHNTFYADGGKTSYGRQGTFFGTQRTGNTTGNNYPMVTFSHYDVNGNPVISATQTRESGGQAPYGYEQEGAVGDWWYNFEMGATVNPSGVDEMAIDSSDAGVWVRHRMHAKIGQNGVKDGIMEWWKDNTLIQRTPQIHRYFPDGYEKIDGMYLLGWFNAGFVADTVWKIDDVSIYDSDPGWTF